PARRRRAGLGAAPGRLRRRHRGVGRAVPLPRAHARGQGHARGRPGPGGGAGAGHRHRPRVHGDLRGRDLLRGAGGRAAGAELPATLVAAVVALCLLPFTTSNAYYLDIVVQIYMWAAAAVAWNLLGGYAGQFSLGHAAFFGIGAYTSSLLLLGLGLTPWLGMLAGGVLAALFALVVGYL